MSLYVSFWDRQDLVAWIQTHWFLASVAFDVETGRRKVVTK